MTVTEQDLSVPRGHLGRGDMEAAIAASAALLEREPEAAEAWHLKSLAEHRLNRMQDALSSAARAVEVGGDEPRYLMMEGQLLHDVGDLAGAERRFARVIELQPAWAAGHLAMGEVRMDAGRAPEALESFRAAVDRNPSHVRAWNNLGAAQQSMGKLDDAIRTFGHILTIDPRFALAHFNLARLYAMRNDIPLGLRHAQEASRLDSSHVDTWLLIGDLQRRNRDMAACIAAYQTAARTRPDHLRACIALAEALGEVGRVDEARAGYRVLSQRFPTSLRAALGSNLLLPGVYRDTAHLEQSRAEYTEGLARLQGLAPQLAMRPGARNLHDSLWTNFYLAYQGRDDLALQSKYGDFMRSVLAPAAERYLQPIARRPRRERLRIGFVSHHFYDCTAGRYFMSWITHLDPKRFETYVYATNEYVSNDTRTIAAAAASFKHRPGRPVLTLADEILADELDVLIYPELGMHPGTMALGHLRLAPVQCAGWGHPDTTGLPEIDYFLSSEAMEPANAQRHYREKLALLPGLGTRYAIPKVREGATRATFGLPEDKTLYLLPQSLFKIHPDNDAAIAEVLSRDPSGHLLLFASPHEALTSAFAERMGAAFAARGMQFGERALFLQPFMPHPDYVALNGLCDVMLDTRHWSGGNTSLDALVSGLPVVTLPGEFMRGRQSLGMLEAMQVPELIARDSAEYVDIAARLGRDPDERRAIAERLRAGRDALFERDEPVRALERFLEGL